MHFNLLNEILLLILTFYKNLVLFLDIVWGSLLILRAFSSHDVHGVPHQCGFLYWALLFFTLEISPGILC